MEGLWGKDHDSRGLEEVKRVYDCGDHYGWNDH